ncbi:THO complex subunit HPR1 [Nakaseomyces bracarensis]|uniref:THO complex subunit HPR1 n=1 Tax=Nakaseomyces bracarensis TaxID=273131 RepID=A0ABR4NWU9_9SACH
MESLVSTEAENLLKVFKGIADNHLDILEYPLAIDRFNEVDLKWTNLVNKVHDADEKDLDIIKELILKKIINELFPINEDVKDEEDTESSRKVLIERLNICAVLLDFTFNTRFHMSDYSQCSVIYFEIFSHLTDLLNWPYEIKEFWSYTESRIHFFKCGNSLEVSLLGESQLISYKPPLFDKLRKWNEMLLHINKRGLFNNPNDNEMKNKWLIFISALLPVNEESNFNRSGTITKNPKSNKERNMIRYKSPGRNKSQEGMFMEDYCYVLSEFIESPFEYICSSFDHKLELDNVLSAIIDSLLDLEDEFYTLIKKEKKSISSINATLTPNYTSTDYATKPNIPKFMDVSEKVDEINRFANDELLKSLESIKHIPQPTAFEISLKDADSLYQQMMILENDFYRKQFLIQVYFTCLLIERILTKEDVYEFYNNNNSKTKAKETEMFGRLNEQNIKKATLFSQHLIENRINKFYCFKDPEFYSLLKSLSVSEDCFVMLKLNGFKQFGDILVSSNIATAPVIDKSFKKFGFVKMGNKQINNVWKIETGFSNLRFESSSPATLYQELKENLNDSVRFDDNKDIVKTWQILRSLRSQYLFDFTGFNENNGLKGLYEKDANPPSTNLKIWKEQSIKDFNEPHRLKLQQAREYVQKRNEKKREHELSENGDNKRQKTEGGQNEIPDSKDVVIQKSDKVDKVEDKTSDDPKELDATNSQNPISATDNSNTDNPT